MIGLSGAHRTGKTTLGMEFAKQMGIPFVRTSATEVFAAIERDPKADYPIAERIGIQEAILYAFERQYAYAREQAGTFIADRTPIDLASYMIADVQRTTTAEMPEVATLINDYVERCLVSASQWFSVIVLVQPGITLVEAPGKAPACPAYIEHLNFAQKGLMMDPRLLAKPYFIPRTVLDLQGRVDSVKNAIEHATDFAKAIAKRRDEMGVYLH